ncbi:formin-like protein 18 [Camellia sinensis]|uniref:formin-like protein 18 n=1 Tax=Camellia sinensis TaxID=4442 RepID=UPI0010367002|nr:formin-like protein 18 [Camellia sinensis]
MALFRRFFYRKPPDRLLEISERVYVFDCCFSTDVLEEDEFKIYMGGIVAQLQDHYPDASFMVFNFREKERRSQISDLLSQYDMTVMDYPRHYEGCPLLPLEMIYHFLRSSESWLSLEGQQNVLLMHCERGGWPVLAFILAGLLLYRKQYSGEQKTLEMVYKQAPRQLLHLLSPLNPQPSQLRYLQYISRRDLGSDWPPSDTPLDLDCIILRVIPLFDGGRGCRPVVHIYGQDSSSTTATKSSKLLFSTSKTKKRARHYQQEECELVKIDIHCRVQGDVVLECIHLDNDLVREEMMFRVMFHTAFVRSNVLMLNRDEVDVLWGAKDQFPKEFKAEVIFSDADAVLPIITTESEDEDEEESASPEEFFEVEEIFSNVVDGQDRKGNLDTHIVLEENNKVVLEENNKVIWTEALEPHAFEDCASDDGNHKQDGGFYSKSSSAEVIAFDDRDESGSIIMIADVPSSLESKVVTADMNGKLEEMENRQEREDSAMQKNLERQDSQQKLSAHISRQKSDESLPPTPEVVTAYMSGRLEEMENGQETEESGMQKNLERQDSQQKLSAHISGQKSDESLPSIPKVVTADMSGKLEEMENRQETEESAMQKNLERQDSEQKLSARVSIQKSDQLLPPTPKVVTADMSGKLEEMGNRQETEDSAMQKNLERQDSPQKLSDHISRQKSDESLPAMPKVVTADMIGKLEEMENRQETEDSAMQKNLERQDSQQKLSVHISRQKSDESLPATPKVVTTDMSGKLEEMENRQETEDSAMQKNLGRQDSQQKLSAHTSRQKSDVSLPATPKVVTAEMSGKLGETENRQETEDSAMQKNLERQDSQHKLSAHISGQKSDESLPPTPKVVTAYMSGKLEEMENGQETEESGMQKNLERQDSQQKLSAHISGQKSDESLPPTPKVVTADMSGKLEEMENKQEAEDSAVRKNLERQDSQKNLSAHISRQKSDKSLPPTPKKQQPSNGKTAADLSPTKQKIKQPEHQGSIARQAKPNTVSRWILPDKSYTNSMYVPYPPSRYNSAPPALALEKDSHADGKSKASAANDASGAVVATDDTPESGSHMVVYWRNADSEPLKPISYPPSLHMPPLQVASSPSSTSTLKVVPPPPPPPPPSFKNSSNVLFPQDPAILPQAVARQASPPSPASPPPPFSSFLLHTSSSKFSLPPASTMQVKAKSIPPPPPPPPPPPSSTKCTLYPSAPEFDVSELETLFSATVPKSNAGGKSGDRLKPAGSKTDKVHLVDLRRANNTEIMLTKVKMPLSDMMAAALAMDESILDADQVENLIKFCPTKEEMDLLKGYTGDKEILGKCEQFFLVLMKVPRVESKLRVFLFKIQFNSQISDFKKSLNTVNSSCEEVRNSLELKEIMKKILFLGNTLNQGTARGSAVGFKLDSLLKLTDTRASNSRMTLMHYLCKVLAAKSPAQLGFHQDLVSLEAASKIQLKSLAEEMQAIIKGLEKVKQELVASENDGPVSEVFHKTLKEFIGTAETEVASVTNLYSVVGRNADGLALYFGEDPARCPFEQVTVTLLNFVRLFRKAHDENCKQAELEKKKAQKEVEMEKAKGINLTKKSGNS